MKSILIIIQDLVPLKVFNKILVDYGFEEFDDDTKENNESIL